VSGAETLEQLRRELAPAIAAAAAFDGWSEAAVRCAAMRAGVAPELALLAFEQADGSLAMAMIAAWIAHIDAEMAVALPVEALAGLPVRERMGRLIRFRLEAVAGCEEALRRAMAIMAMPQNVVKAARLGWSSADAMWRLAGDTAADYNHYTKRAMLAAIYAATLAVFAGDTSEGKAETLSFLDRRIAGVMRFEKAKGRLMGGDGIGPFSAHFSVGRFLGRLRYPVS
jgi:ubiquinone biosynthesis protein COQ9